MRQKPTVLAREIVATSRLFCVEELKLRFPMAWSAPTSVWSAKVRAMAR